MGSIETGATASTVRYKRAFSVVRIKTHLRSRMWSYSLSDLAVLSIERERSMNLPKLDLINTNASTMLQKLRNCMYENYLAQHVTKPTWQNNILDMVFSRRKFTTNNCCMRYEAPLGRSDHVTLIFRICINHNKEHYLKNASITYWWKLADWQMFNKTLRTSD